MSGTRPLALG